MAKEKQLVWSLRLYIAGNTPKSIIARKNIEQYCQVYLPKMFKLEIIDLQKNPQLAEDHQILAIPTLVRLSPGPVKKIIGDLSNEEKVLQGLEIEAVKK